MLRDVIDRFPARCPVPRRINNSVELLAAEVSLRREPTDHPSLGEGMSAWGNLSLI